MGCLRLVTHYMCNLDQITAHQISSFEDYDSLWSYLEKPPDHTIPETEASRSSLSHGQSVQTHTVIGTLSSQGQQVSRRCPLHFGPLSMEVKYTSQDWDVRLAFPEVEGFGTLGNTVTCLWRKPPNAS